MFEDEDGEELDFLASGSNVLTIPAKLLANKPKPKSKPKPRGSARANLKRQRSSANINFDEDIDEALEEEEDFEPVQKSGKPKKAEKQLMQMATKSETPRDFWDTLDRFWEMPDIDQVNKWITQHESSYLTASLPPLGRHYTERWEDESRGKNPDAGADLKQPDGYGVDLSDQAGYYGLHSVSLLHHTVAQRMVSALIQLPKERRKTQATSPPSEPVKDTLDHAKEMAEMGTVDDWNQSLHTELIHMGLIDADDDLRLRIRDCEDNVICQHFRAAQDNLKAVRKMRAAERGRLEQALNQAMPALERRAHLEDSNKKLEQQFKKGIKAGLAEWRNYKHAQRLPR